jgi:septal ring factor EnvC (AmiA/AmiB activator)
MVYAAVDHKTENFSFRTNYREGAMMSDCNHDHRFHLMGTKNGCLACHAESLAETEYELRKQLDSANEAIELGRQRYNELARKLRHAQDQREFDRNQIRALDNETKQLRNQIRALDNLIATRFEP